MWGNVGIIVNMGIVGNMEYYGNMRIWRNIWVKKRENPVSKALST
jgi:hypothetical protein